MLLAKRNNYYPEFNSLFNDFFNDSYTNEAYKPNRSKVAVNVMEEDETYVLELAVPGYKKEDFSIKVEENVLTIASEKKVDDEVKSSKYTRREFRYESFSRSFSLPEGLVDDAKISAEYVDGILNVKIPKTEAAKPHPMRKINIK